MQRPFTAIVSLVGGRLVAAAVIALAVVLAGVVAAPETARAQYAPWCAQYGAQTGSYDCSYYTFEQCMATVRGVGGFCQQNPRMPYIDQRLRRQRGDRW